MTTRVGAGNAAFRVGGEEGEADTVVFGLFRREVYERVGEVWKWATKWPSIC